MHTFTAWNPFAPDVALYTLHEVLLVGIRYFLHWFVIVNVQYRLLVLCIVQVERSVRCEDQIVALAGRLAWSEFRPTAPPHDGSRFRQASFDDFVPTNHFLAFRVEEMFHFVNEPCLEFFFGLQTVFLHACLAIRTFLPVGLFHFIATDVNVFVWEEFDEFGIYIFAEFKSRIFARTYWRREGRAPACFFEARYTVIVTYGSQHVTWHIEFRDDIDTAYLGIGNYFLHVFLGIETSIKCITFHYLHLVSRDFIVRVVLFGSILHAVTVVVVEFTPCAFFCKKWIFLNFQSPTLVVGKVPMELVQFIECHEVEEFHDFFLGIEVAGDIEHQTTPTKTWCILNLYRRDTPTHATHLLVGFYLGWEELAQRLDTGDDTTVSITCDVYTFRIRYQRIGIFCTFHGTNAQVDISLPFAYLETIPGGW